MARRIKDTPILTGRHALKFQKEIKLNESRKVSRESYQRALKAYSAISQPKVRQGYAAET